MIRRLQEQYCNLQLGCKCHAYRSQQNVGYKTCPLVERGNALYFIGFYVITQAIISTFVGDYTDYTPSSLLNNFEMPNVVNAPKVGKLLPFHLPLVTEII